MSHQKPYGKSPTLNPAYRPLYDDMIKPGIFLGELADLDVYVIMPSLKLHLALNVPELAWSLSTNSKGKIYEQFTKGCQPTSELDEWPAMVPNYLWLGTDPAALKVETQPLIDH